MAVNEYTILKKKGGSEVVKLTCRPRFTTWVNPKVHSEAGRIRHTEKCNNLIGNGTRNLPICSIVPQQLFCKVMEIIKQNRLDVCETRMLRIWKQSSENVTEEYIELSAKLVPTLADRRCHVVSATDPHGRILGFLDRSRYCFFQVAPQLYSRGWMVLVPDPLLLRKSGSAGNRTRSSGSVASNSNH
jgi:hypothetical protein